MKRSYRASPLVLALLTPTLLQMNTCGANSDVALTSLEVIAAGTDRIIGFQGGDRSYVIGTTAGVDTITVRAEARSTEAEIAYELSDTMELASGLLGTGSGEVVLSIPPDTPLTLELTISSTGETGIITSRKYTVDINVDCSATPCDDGIVCSTDTCNAVDRCDFSALPDGTTCDLVPTGVGVCTAGLCAEPQSNQCDDGIDNDGDGLIDLADLGCESAADDDEGDLFCGSGELIDLSDVGTVNPPRVFRSPDAGAVSVVAGNTVYGLDPPSLSQIRPRSLTDDALTVSYSTPTPSTLFANQANGFIVAIDIASSFTISWQRNLRRSGCTEDASSPGPSVYHERETASLAFRQTFGTPLVYAATFYQASPGCATGETTDNRVYALDATNGQIEWTFNQGLTASTTAGDVDAIVGLALDIEADQLYVGTLRASPSQDNLWAIDVLDGSLVWSTNVGSRVGAPPVLFDGRLYVVNQAGRFAAIDPSDGSEIWGLDGPPRPVSVDRTLVLRRQQSGSVLLAIANLLGEITAVEATGDTAELAAWFQLPNGDPGGTGAFPPVQSTGDIVVDDLGRALVGGDDGRVYSVDLLEGTVAGSIEVDVPGASVDSVVLEPAGLNGTPGSFLIATDQGTVARYCTTLEPPLNVCNDGIDNDGDGLTDAGDPGCANALDANETTPLLQCDDGLDNDGDGDIDFLDSGCDGPVGTEATEPFVFCGTDTPIETSDLTVVVPSIRVFESPDSTAVNLVSFNTLYALDRATLDRASEQTLTDVVVSLSYSSPSASTIFAGQENGWFSGVSTAGGLQIAFRRNLARSGCAADGVSSGPAAFHDPTVATEAFNALYGGPLVYVGTAYASSTGCVVGQTTDNRVYALDPSDGSTVWTFNGSGSIDLDVVAGLALNVAADRLYVTSERTSASQDSLWAINVLTGALVWSANAGRIRVPPVLLNGRLYIANTSGQVKAFDAVTGAEIWSVIGGTQIPILNPLTVTQLPDGTTLVAAVNALGLLRVVEDLGGSGEQIAYFALPDGAPVTGSPPVPDVRATSEIAVDSLGRALVGADDGKVYAVDLVSGAVTNSIDVDIESASVNSVVLEPGGVFSALGSFLIGTDQGTAARYCTEFGSTQ
ncbi:MAG: PQQ-binding-like beta-propeller repeat protein [Myxococcota bacterium]